MSEGKEGWDVPQRMPLIAMVIFVAVLAVLVVIGGRIYLGTIAARTRPPEAEFPAPRLELTQTPPGLHRRDYRQLPPPDIDRAMAETAARGAAIWNGSGS